jgi:hypothetical protein
VIELPAGADGVADTEGRPLEDHPLLVAARDALRALTAAHHGTRAELARLHAKTGSVETHAAIEHHGQPQLETARGCSAARRAPSASPARRADRETAAEIEYVERFRRDAAHVLGLAGQRMGRAA